jgi:release factor glutamine methyltransferase
MVVVIEHPETLEQAARQPLNVDWGMRRLSEAGIIQPRQEIDILAALADEDHVIFEALVEKRCSRVPLEHLTGVARFRQLDLLVGPGVFVPQPETECVVQWAVDCLRRVMAAGEPNPLCVDLCTGSGTIALSVASEVPNAVVHAVEVDPAALEWAARNEAHHRCGVLLHACDVADALPELDGQFDLVISNPPYVATGEIAGVRPEVRDHDPVVALAAGFDGLSIIRQIEQTAHRLLKRGGFVVVEHSDRQGVTAPEIFHRGGAWSDVEDHRDHDLLDRFLTAEKR